MFSLDMLNMVTCKFQVVLAQTQEFLFLYKQRMRIHQDVAMSFSASDFDWVAHKLVISVFTLIGLEK